MAIFSLYVGGVCMPDISNRVGIECFRPPRSTGGESFGLLMIA